jgi:argininosuccinate lyase
MIAQKKKLIIYGVEGSLPQLMEIMEEFNSSIQFDKILYLEDIEGSLAHSEMLSRQKIISNKDFELIKTGLNQIKD